MQKKQRDVSTVEFRTDISDIVNSVYYGNEHVRLMRRGKPLAVLISLDDYEKILSKS